MRSANGRERAKIKIGVSLVLIWRSKVSNAGNPPERRGPPQQLEACGAKTRGVEFLGCPEDLDRADLRPQTIALGHSFGLIPRLPSARDIPPPNSCEW